MAIIARYSFDVPFGKKSEAFAVYARFEPVERELGFPKPRMLVGSIGAPESRIEADYEFPSMAALEDVWSRLNDPRMAEQQQAMAPYVVPGSHRWQIFRVHEL